MRRLVPVFALLILVAPLAARASNAIAKQQNLVCTVCHDKPGSKLLTSEGKYFELMGSLDGYDEVMREFGSCTSCHVRKPGSKKLTETGKRFEWMMKDMQGLKTWLNEVHPVAPAEESKDGPATEETGGDQSGSPRP